MTKRVVPASNVEWRLFGKLDLGVSHDFEAGLAEWRILREHLRHYGLSRWDVCVEIGCGTGRLTNAAVEDFLWVHALDCSPERLAQARQIPNAAKCVFHEARNPLIPLPECSCALVFSVHTFQHLSPRRAVQEYFLEAYRVLRSAGVLMVHLPVVGAHGFTGEISQLLALKIAQGIRTVSTAWLRLLMNLGLTSLLVGVGRRATRMGWRRISRAGSIYRIFSFVEVAQQLEKMGFRRIELRILPVRAGHESYVLAMKS